MPNPTLITFLGGLGSSPAELTVAAARRAATLDTIESALSTGAYARVILATDDPDDLPAIPNLAVDLDDGPFHFGDRLAGLIERDSLDRVVYLGGGSLPLLSTEDFHMFAEAIDAPWEAVTNNIYSSDMVGLNIDSFDPKEREEALSILRSVVRDNALARAVDETFACLHEISRTVATQMDIDAPPDLAILALTREGGPRLREYVRSLDLDLSRYERVLPLLTDREAQIVVAGRVGSHAWRYLERETACRVRLFAEERGLEAERRSVDRTARSLLGFYIEAAGLEHFFEILPELGDAALIDTRVLLAHFAIDATREDRFLSDLGSWPDIHDPFLRDFTRAAAEAPIPVILGGHSLMSGGLMALNEHAWRQHDANA
jgi:hypothetical protein